MLTYITLPQIPHPPKTFIDQAKAITQKFYDGQGDDLDALIKNQFMYQNNGVSNGYGERMYVKNGKQFGSRRQHVFDMGPDWEQWVKDYLHPFPWDCGVSVSVPLHWSSQGPHCDLRRRYALNYIIDCGGENVRTVWYREKGKPIERLHETGPEGMSYWVQNYDDLEVIDDVCFSPGIWILYSTKILHSAENMVGPRSFLTTAIPDMDQFPWKNRQPR